VYDTYAPSPDTPNGLHTGNEFDAVCSHVVPGGRTDKGEWIAGRSLHGEDPHRVAARTGPVTGDGPTSATSTLGFSIWPTQSSPIPIIRNED
jgi:hypothetical protein